MASARPQQWLKTADFCHFRQIVLKNHHRFIAGDFKALFLSLLL